MKKSLSVALSATVVMSMFSSMAFAKTSADFTDLKDLDAATQAKFDAMISAGIFDGVSDTTFGLKDEMNRAQFAKVAALIMGLDVDKDLKTSSFSDVQADDPANGYALPYIEALKTAGVTDGYADGQYNPAGKVTKEQLATFLDRVLGKDADAKAKTGNDPTVSDWAQGYVALALELKLLPNGEDGQFGGQSNATRDLLLTGAYEAKQQFVPAGKISMTGAKAAGVQKVQVTFNKPVDTTTATLALTRGTADVATTATWSDDKKTATLNLTDEKVHAGDYKVAVSGLDEASVDKTTASFTGEDEALKDIVFVSSSDTIAQSKSTVVKAKATNQYGENASFNAGSYTVYPGGANFVKVSKQDDGLLAITLDTSEAQAGVGVVSLSIVNNDQHVTASKNFKVGTAPILSKLELGDAQYSNSSKAITGKGDTAKFDLNLYDQYGGNIAYDSPDFNKDNVNVIWNDYVGNVQNTNTPIISTEMEDNGSNIPRLKISLNDNIDKSADYSFTVIDQAATATGKISIKSGAVATKVELGDFNDVIAAGDKDVYIPIVAYDANGNQLSIDDLTSDSNRDRIKITAAGVDGTIAGQGQIMDSGAHRGYIHLMNISDTSRGSVSLSALIATPNAQSNTTKTYTISDVRVPDRIKEAAKPSKEIVAGANSSFQYQILDQYGKVMDYNLSTVGTSGNGNAVSNGSGNVNYDVEVSLKNADAGAFTVTRDDDSELINPLADGASKSADFTGSDETDPAAFKQFNKGLRVTAADGQEGKKATLHIAIRKLDVSGKTDPQELTYVDQQLTVAPKANASTGEDWTISMKDVSKMYNTLDSGILEDQDFDGVSTDKIVANPLKRRVNFSVKNAAGDAVAIPNSFVASVTSSNPTAVRVAQNTSNGKWYAIGNKTGTATLTATYVDNKGKTKTATQTITVSSDAMEIAQMTADNKATVKAGASYAAVADYAAPGATAVTNGVLYSEGLTNLHITDSYGLALDGNNINKANFAYGLTYTIQHVNATAGDASNVTIDANNVVSIASGFQGTFDLVVTAPSGKTTTTQVTAN